MYDPEANFVYGVAARRLGRLVDAKETLGWAARSPQFEAVALVQSAEIALFEKDYDRASEQAMRALFADNMNVGALEVLAVSHRLGGRKAEHGRALGWLLDLDPLNHLARFERYLLDRAPESLEACRALVRNELPHETFIEMAAFYDRLGRTGDAVEALKAAPAHATVDYWLAYLQRDASPRRAPPRSTRPRPPRPSRLPVPRGGDRRLLLAVAAKPSDWKPKYYLALVYCGKGRLEEARDLFEMCEGADYAPFWIARGAFYERTEPARAAADYARAVELEAASWRPVTP